jgi:DNA-binding GntR family transcriptional regulator
VRDLLRDAIVSGELLEGSRLKIVDLARRYGLSQMPIREALQQLQGEELVVIAPNRGASVRVLDETFISNIFGIREALESYLARLAAERATDADLARLRAAQSRYEMATQAQDMAVLPELNRAFHAVLNTIAGNAEAVALLQRHGDLLNALRARFGYSVRRRVAIRREHRELIAAIAEHRADAAAAIAAVHARGALLDLLALRAKKVGAA